MTIEKIDPSLVGKRVRIQNYLDKRGNLYPAGIYNAEELSAEVLNKAKISIVNGDTVEEQGKEIDKLIPETKVAVLNKSISGKIKTKETKPVVQNLTPEEAKTPTK